MRQFAITDTYLDIWISIFWWLFSPVAAIFTVMFALSYVLMIPLPPFGDSFYMAFSAAIMSLRVLTLDKGS